MVGAGERIDLGRILREHRLSTPSHNEVLDLTVLDLVRQATIGLAPAGSLSGIVDAGRGRDQNEPRDPLGGGQGNVQGDASAHRVAGEHEALGAALEHALHAPVEGDRPRHAALFTVPREIQRERAVAFRWQMRQNPIPCTTCPAESVQQDDALEHMRIL